MIIDENKYNNLFINKFKVRSNELHSEFKRIIDEYGYTEEVKLEFYSKLFETVIAQFKNDLPKDENYDFIISTLYKYFIEALQFDNIENTKFKKGLELFKAKELPTYSIVQKVEPNGYEPVYKNYNLNTKYGRRKAREQANSNYQNGTPEYRREIDNIRAVFWVIFFIIAIIVVLVKAKLS